MYAQKAGKISVVENPASSWMWQTKRFRPLLKTGLWHEPHACEYGSRRQKKTGLLSTIPLPGMHKVCSGNHVHLQRGPIKSKQGWSFATLQETACPPEFCKAVARDIAIALQPKGFSLLQEPEATQAAHAAIASQKQPRKGHGPVGRVAVTIPAAVDPPQEIPEKAPHGLQGIFIGSKLLWSREILKGGSWVREVEHGVFHTPEVFLEKSLKIAHPFDSPVSMDAPNMRATANILSEGVEGIKAKRKAALDYYRARKVALQKDELALKAKMHPDVRGVMQPKNLLLFKEMLRDACVSDENLFHDLTSGFRITGELEPSGQFPPKRQAAALSVDDLRKTAKWAKHLVESSCRKASKDKAAAKAVWQESLDQVQRGWLRGPYSSSEIDARVGPVWVASKRFGIVQGEKMRAVDDLSEYMVNSTVSESEKIVLDGVDEILAVARFFGGATTGGKNSSSQRRTAACSEDGYTMTSKKGGPGSCVEGPWILKVLTSNLHATPRIGGRQCLRCWMLIAIA